MNTQPEALLCAEMLEVARDTPTWADYSEIPKEACRRSAAELRRLSADNDLLGSAADKLRTLHSDERMELLRQRDQAKAQRDALLEALKLALSSHGVMLTSYPPQDAWKFYGVEEKARAAIAKAEEGK